MFGEADGLMSSREMERQDPLWFWYPRTDPRQATCRRRFIPPARCCRQSTPRTCYTIDNSRQSTPISMPDYRAATRQLGTAVDYGMQQGGYGAAASVRSLRHSAYLIAGAKSGTYQVQWRISRTSGRPPKLFSMDQGPARRLAPANNPWIAVAVMVRMASPACVAAPVARRWRMPGCSIILASSYAETHGAVGAVRGQA